MNCTAPLFAPMFAVLMPLVTTADVIHVDARAGRDVHPGTLQQPVRTLERAACLIRDTSGPGPTRVVVGPGIYSLSRPVIFGNQRLYTRKQRFVLEAATLPDDPDWVPSLMPLIVPAIDPGPIDAPDRQRDVFGLHIELNHATVRGFRFLGSPAPNAWYGAVYRSGMDLDDLVVTQCMFVADRFSAPINVGVIANGHGLVVDHCVFYNCRNSVVFWNATGGTSRDNAMSYCIVDGAYTSGVWVCQTDEDFGFHHNIITRCRYAWMRDLDNTRKYSLRDCIVTANTYRSGKCDADWALRETGPRIGYDESGVIREGEVALEMGEGLDLGLPRAFLHVVAGTLGSDLGVGLFIDQNEDRRSKHE